MAYPTTLDDLSTSIGTASDPLSTPSHVTHHTNEDTAIEALEAKVGADSSAVTTSHDYKLGDVTGSDKASSLAGTETLTNKTIDLTDNTLTGTTAEFNTALSDENFATIGGTETLAGKTLTTPDIGTPSAGTLTNCDGLPLTGLVDDTSTALGVGSIELGHASDTSVARVSAGVISVEGVTIPSISSTDTLTNKRVQPRTQTDTSSATPTPTGDSTDIYTITALATNPTFAAPTGTPTEGQKLIIRVKDDGTSRTLSWNAIYRASTDLAFPVATTISKTMYFGFMYNNTDSKWDLIALLDNL